jgi:uncharacterized protein (DUF885 family)
MRWRQFTDQALEEYFELQPDFAVFAGRHDFDGRLPDWSEAGLQKLVDFLKATRGRAEEFQDAQLSKEDRFARKTFLAALDGQLFFIEKARTPFRSPIFYSNEGLGMDPSVYVTREYAPLPVRLRAFTKYALAVPNAVAQARHNLKLPLPKTFIEIGRITFGGLATFLDKDVPSVFAGVNDAQLQTDFKSAKAGAVKAFKDFDQWLEAQLPSATTDFALGPDLFKEMLWATERVDVPLDQLERIGRADLEKNSKSLIEVCTNYAPGKTVEECVAAVNAKKPALGPVEEAKKQLVVLKRFLIDHDIVGIPGTEEAKVDASPPYMRWNAAYIDIPGPFERGLPSIYYIAPPDPSWSERERAEYIPGEAVLWFTSAHEVWPGHFLQFLHSNRSPSKIERLFLSYAFVEGWAHYTEQMMWDAGLGADNPEMHIGQLSDALLRDVRLLSALGLHTGKMTVADSEKMFREKAYQDAANTKQQARRGTFDPAYLNYTMGKLMIQKLREDWTASRGGRAGWRAFHDEFLSHGGPPIPLLRESMMGTNSASLF